MSEMLTEKLIFTREEEMRGGKIDNVLMIRN